MSKAVVLLSGGIDSATCLGIACQEHDEVIPVHYRYGQQTQGLEGHMAEQQKINFDAQGNAEVHDLQIVNYESPFAHFARGVAGNRASFTTESGELTEDDGRSTGYVPMRNLHLIATGAAIADVRGADAVYHGAQAGDEAAYPDCRPAFMDAAAQAINRSLADGDHIQLTTPLVNLSKVEVIHKGANVGVDWKYTYSCYDGVDEWNDPTPCGECPACEERIEAFSKTGIEDPYMPEETDD